MRDDIFCGNVFSSVVCFTNDLESLRINEGDSGTLTVGFLKPPAGVGEMASVSFTIDNSQNTGMLHICNMQHTHVFLVFNYFSNCYYVGETGIGLYE